jgi:hypothetical protein
VEVAAEVDVLPATGAPFDRWLVGLGACLVLGGAFLVSSTRQIWYAVDRWRCRSSRQRSPALVGAAEHAEKVANALRYAFVGDPIPLIRRAHHYRCIVVARSVDRLARVTPSAESRLSSSCSSVRAPRMVAVTAGLLVIQASATRDIGTPPVGDPLDGSARGR